MASTTPPVPANHHKPRRSNSNLRQVKKDASANQTKATVSDSAMRGWKLPDVIHEAQLERNRDNDVNDVETDDEYDDRDHDALRTEVINAIKSQGTDVATEEAYQELANKYDIKVLHQIRKEIEEKDNRGTLLHYIVETLQQNIEQGWNWRVWVKLILDVAKRHNLRILRQAKTQDEGVTCLRSAVEACEKGLDFIRFICTIADKRDLEDTIAVENIRGQNCLERAIAKLFVDERSNQPPKPRLWLPRLHIVEALTVKASPGTLAKGRGKRGEDKTTGNLPLHDLVDVSLCRVWVKKCSPPEAKCAKCAVVVDRSQEYRKVYLSILATMVKNYEALKKMNNSSQSPFLFHCHTRDKLRDSQNLGPLDFTKLIAPAAVGTDGQPKEGPIRQPTSKTKDGHRDGKDKNEIEAGLGETSGGPNGTKHPSAKFQICKDLATTVFQMLLEICLSQKSFSDICDSLFGEKYPRSELIFKATPLTDRTIDLHASLPLDPVLACVELGLDDSRIPALDGVVSARNAKMDLEKNRGIREDRVKELFKWLQDDRNVKRIIKLVVYDHPQAPCRDEVIESCLKEFDVRHLDWNKEDLSVDILQNIVPNLQELWLTWSGRKSALFGWCNEKYGLRMLTKLTRLYVATGGEWESPERNGESLQKFREALKEGSNMPKLEVKDGNEMALDTESRNSRVEFQGVKEGNIWIEAINTFHKALREKTKDERKSFKDTLKYAVKIAIIDDGVDLPDLSTTEYITGGWCPDLRAPERKRINAWYYSEKRHGTEMARLIQLVFPYLGLYIAKLDTERRVYKSIAASAAEAIYRAIDHGANVISMSWTMYRSSVHDNDGIEKMKTALKKAAEKKIIMFCASEDSGHSGYRDPYPATDCDSKVLKRIGSAGVYGERSEYVNPQKVDFLFPGEVAMSDTRVCSGSSAATALAAGLAGLILWCCALEKNRCEAVEKPKAAAKTNLVNKEPTVMAPPKRVNSKPMTGPVGRQPPPDSLDFQDHRRMYGLFTELRSSPENPFVNVTKILHLAADSEDPAGMLVRKCKERAYNSFEET